MRQSARSLGVIVTAWIQAAAITVGAQGSDQDFCGTMRRLIDESRTDFVRIAPASREAYRDATLVLPNAKECYVASDEIGGEYICNWIADSPAKAMREFAVLADGLAACFAGPQFGVERDAQRFRARQTGSAVVTARWDRDTLKIRLRVSADR